MTDAPSPLLARALEAAGDAVIVIDRDGLVRAWNPASERLFGHRAADMIGQDVAAMIPERLRPLHDRGFAAAMAAGRLASDGAPRRTKAIRPDGSSVYVVMTFAVVTDETGAAIGSVAVAREWLRDE
ncbi:PAS domain S-box protein [Arsenicicoccus dermatophilus]|uniref:PAS domain S-box protein n=1 Tax=Arsenicicoccus dermatophilus TaxID=1076331 RepID=UPI003916F74A